MLGGKAGVLHPPVVSKIRLSKTCQNPRGCNLFQDLEQMAEGKAILAVVHSSNTGHASTASEKSVFK